MLGKVHKCLLLVADCCLSETAGAWDAEPERSLLAESAAVAWDDEELCRDEARVRASVVESWISIKIALDQPTSEFWALPDPRGRVNGVEGHSTHGWQRRQWSICRMFTTKSTRARAQLACVNTVVTFFGTIQNVYWQGTRHTLAYL